MTPNYSKILVAGGAGFIGSHIVDRLLSEGFEVTVMDNLYTGRLENITQHKENRNFHFIKGNIRNFNMIKRAVKDADAVLNEAAVVSIPRSVENPLLANEVNVTGTLNLMKACLDSGVKRFIQASSASIYGETRTLPIHEELTPNPLSPYAVSELAAENYAKVFYTMYGLETVCLRYFNVYGPRQTYSPYSGAITIFINQLFNNQPPTIYGDGKQTRDFISVGDVVDANMLALVQESAPGEVFNIATGVAVTINQLVEMLEEIMGKKDLKPIYVDPRPGDIKHSVADINKARKILGFEPRISLKKGLTQLVEWHAKQVIFH